MSKKNIVVVGGGGSGTQIARLLSTKLDIATQTLTLINARPFNVFLPGQVRAVVTDKGHLEKETLIPYDKLFVGGKGTVKVGTVTAIEPNKEGKGKGGFVLLESGERVPYDVLVLAQGATWEGPLAVPGENSDAHYALWRTKIKEADHVVFAGGGPVGIEIAGEIKDTYPKKKVTIVHGGNSLLRDIYPEKFRKVMHDQLTERGVELVYNDYIDEVPEPGTVSITTRKGRTFTDVLVVPARGGRVNTGFVASSLGPSSVTGSGHVRIKPTFQLADHPDIYAIGDITDWDENKQFAKYKTHAQVAAPNVLASAAGQQPSGIYKGQPEIIVITNGAAAGGSYFGFLWGLVFGKWVTKTMKSKSLFIPMGRSNLGY